MQVDDEHLSLTDQKDQVRDPPQVHSQRRLHVPGWGSKRVARPARVAVGLWRTDPVFPLYPVINHGTWPFWGALTGHLGQLQTLNSACEKWICLS